MDYVDYKYIMLLSSRLDRFKDTGNRTYNFRCPYCGDSQKDKRKSRGYLLYNSKKNSVRFFCHNCGASSSLSTFIKNIAPDLHGQYKVETFGAAMRVKTPESKTEQALSGTASKTFNRLRDPLGKCHRLSNCPSTLEHIKRYAESRSIPENLFSEIYAAESVNDITSRLAKYKDSEYPKVPMLVMPFFRKDGSYSYIQCRVADPEADPDFRFLTIQVDGEGPKLYGENHVDWAQPVYVLEGPIDAMFIDNGVANAGASSSMSYVIQQVTNSGKPLSNVCMLFDNDYSSNAQVMEHIIRGVNNGMSVVLFDKQFNGIKDINKAITSGWSRKEVNDYVRSRTFNGLRAKLELSPLGKGDK